MLQFLLMLIVPLAVAGLVLWAVTQFPLDATIARLIRVGVIFVVVIWLLIVLVNFAGGMPPLNMPHRF